VDGFSEFSQYKNFIEPTTDRTGRNPMIKFSKKPEPVVLSKRFQRTVALHILKNMLKRAEAQVPLLLGVHGPSGEGKTFQVENILKQMGVKRFLISGGQMESPVTGQPAQLIRNYYIRASEAIRGGECAMAVVLINDIDTGLGAWGENEAQFTINQQAVFGELMHLVDYPTSVEGKDTLRVPIIITGNDFTRLYEPLVRAGRMAAFEWIPNLEERAEIIKGIFPELSKDECRRLVEELNQQVEKEKIDPRQALTIAFYSHLRSTLMDEDLWGEVERGSLERMIDMLLKGDEPDLTLGIHYERVLAKGLELARSEQLVNHLKFNGK
jgi:hypothetical protein